jgi:hypothetical protein
MINFEKMYIVSATITEIQRFQQTPYLLQEVPYFGEFWEKNPVLKEKELFVLAKEATKVK